MANPLFQMLGNSSINGMGNLGNIISQFKNFKQNFKGNPQQKIQELLNSGRISQAQYNQAVQMANSLRGILDR